MSLVMRLRQGGRKNRRMFRVVVADKRSPRDGKYVASVGHYNPHEADGFYIQADKVTEWFKQGVLPSERLITLLKRKAPETLEILQKEPKKSSKK